MATDQWVLRLANVERAIYYTVMTKAIIGARLVRSIARLDWLSQQKVRLQRSFSKSIRGLEHLQQQQVTAVTDAVPSAVAGYAREACRCYLHGFFSASLILCRSCIEAAIETKLDQEGLRKELDRLPFNKVQELLRLAVNSGVLDDLTSHLADGIRRSATRLFTARRPPKRSAGRGWNKRERCSATSTSRHSPA